jgi:CubicO group peptidase (beta-lactamase class C family)
MLAALVLASTLHSFPPALDQYIEDARRRADVPGLAIVIVDENGVVAAKGYGVRRLGSPERVDENTAFDIASLTKSFTAAAMATLVDEGKLKWDDTLRDRMPAVAFPAALEGRVTVRDLLAHRVALQQGNMLLRLSGYDRDELLQRIRVLKPAGDFRNDFVYSNVMYALAAATAQAVSGKTWGELVSDRLLKPLGMTSSTADHTLPAVNAVSGHAMIKGKQMPVAPFRYSSVEGASGVISTAADLAKWLRFQLGDGTWNGKQIVSARQMAEMHSPQFLIPTTPEFRAARKVNYFAGYGLGWQVMDYQGHPMYWHSGNAVGIPSYMAILPKEKIGVAVMVNSWRVPILHGALAGYILNTMLGLEINDSAGDAIAGYERDLKRGAEMIEGIAQRRVTGTKPSRPAAEYDGTYVDPVHGDITITASNGKLSLKFAKGYVADLEHWHYDTFDMLWRDPVLNEDYHSTVTFTLNDDGKPTRLEIPMRRERVEATRR